MWSNSELSFLVWFFFRVLVMTRCHTFRYADESLVPLGWFWLHWNTSITKFQRSKAGIIAPNRENFAFDGTQSTLLRSKLSCWVGTLVWLWVCLFDVVLRDEFHRTWSLVLLSWLGEKMKHFFNQIRRSRAGIPSMRKPASREIISDSFELVWNWSWFLAHPTCGNKRVTSKYAQNFPWGRFWVFKTSRCPKGREQVFHPCANQHPEK